MTFFIQFRNKIRYFIATREVRVIWVWHTLLSLTALLVIHQVIGYQSKLNHWWVAVILALLCGFLPLQGITAVLMIYGVLHLIALSSSVAVTSLALVLISYGICAYFRTRNMYHIVAVPVCHSLHISFVMPMTAGLLGSVEDLASVICGSALAYYFKVIKENASLFLDASSSVNALGLIQSQMLNSNMFYIYMAAMIVMFLVVYFVRCMNIRYAWITAVISGVLAEFVIMLVGYFVNDGLHQVLGLVVGNAAALCVGLMINFWFFDLDYSRTEKIQFEDDEYYYYVTAVPKIRITVEEKKVERITRTPGTKGGRRRSFDWRNRKGNNK